MRALGSTSDDNTRLANLQRTAAVNDKTSSQVAIANKQVPRGHDASMMQRPGYVAKVTQAGNLPQCQTTVRQACLPILHSGTVF